MSYVQKSYRGTSLWVGGIFLLLVVGRCASMVGGGAPNTPDSAERALMAGPAADVYRTVKRTYPEDFALLTQRIATMSKAGKSHAQIEASLLKLLVEREDGHKLEFAQAGHAALAKYRRAEIEVIRALQSADPQLCATYFVEGQINLPDHVTGPGAAIAKQHIATWETSADGRDRPVGRKIVPPTQADWALIDKAMIASGVPRSTLALFFDPARIRGLPAAVQCETGLSFRIAIDGLPAAKADQFYIALVMGDG